MAEACARVVRDGDCLARIGGDEFALVAPGAAGAGVERIVEALGAAIADAPSPDGVPSVQATFAVGGGPAGHEPIPASSSGSPISACSPASASSSAWRAPPDPAQAAAGTPWRVTTRW